MGLSSDSFMPFAPPAPGMIEVKKMVVVMVVVCLIYIHRER